MNNERDFISRHLENFKDFKSCVPGTLKDQNTNFLL